MNVFPEISGYEVVERLGIGSFSVVFKAHIKHRPKKVCAIKCVERRPFKKSRADRIVNEVTILKMLKNDFIVRMYDFIYDARTVFIIMEYCNQGDLGHFLRRKHKLRESVVRMFMQHISLAMQYLRENKIAHMDLKPANLLLTATPLLVLKIADFGLSHICTSEATEAVRFSGSPLYMAPEKILGRPFDSRVDLWSIGVIMYECLFGRPPYLSINATVCHQMARQVPVDIPCHALISDDCEDLLLRLLRHRPERRISYDEFFIHNFIDLEHMPSLQNYKKARELIQYAIILDGRKNHAESVEVYEEAIKLLEPMLEAEQGAYRGALIKIRLNEYKEWVATLKEYLKNPSTNPEPVRSPVPLCEGHYESLSALCSATPALFSALDIGHIGELFLSEGRVRIAYEKLTVSIGLLIPLLKAEPRGLRRTLLHQQVLAWMKLAEDAKERLPPTPPDPSPTSSDLSAESSCSFYYDDPDFNPDYDVNYPRFINKEW